MSLTTAQLTTFKAAMQADAAVAADLAAGNDANLAAYYNAPNTQATVQNVWRPKIMVVELNAVIVWSAFAALTVALQNTYLAMTQAGFIDATSASVRAGFVTIFGSGTATTNALTAIAKRVATRFEMLFATAAPSSPDNTTTVFGYVVTPDDCQRARTS